MLGFIMSALRALKNALLYGAGVAFELLTWPFRVLSPRGRSAVPPPPTADFSHVKVDEALAAATLETAQPEDFSNAGIAQLLAAGKAIKWAVGVVHGTASEAPLPAGLSASARAWLANLSLDELKLLAKSRTEAVAAHMCGRARIEELSSMASTLSSSPSKAAIAKPAIGDNDVQVSGTGYQDTRPQPAQPPQSPSEDVRPFGLA